MKFKKNRGSSTFFTHFIDMRRRMRVARRPYLLKRAWKIIPLKKLKKKKQTGVKMTDPKHKPSKIPLIRIQKMHPYRDLQTGSQGEPTEFSTE